MGQTSEEHDLIKMIQRAAWLGRDILLPVRAIVKSVDESNKKITVVKVEDESESDAPEYDAYLQSATVGELGIIIIPEKKSSVVIGFPGNKDSQAVVLLYSKIDKIIFNVKTSIEFKIDGKTSSVLAIDGNGIVAGQSSSSEPMLLGNKLKTWAQKVDQAINAIVQWGTGGTAASGGMTDVGGIAPLSGVEVPSFDDATLSQNNKVS